MVFERLKFKFRKWLPKKKNETQDYDFKDDINKNFEKFIEANEQYLQVAGKFFSTSIEEDEASLRKSAEAVILSYAALELYTMFERLSFFHNSSDKITSTLDEIAELMFWIDKRDKAVVSGIEKARLAYGDSITSILYMHVDKENVFLNLVTAHATGLSVILISYFEYIFEQLFTDFSLPTEIENFRRRHKQSKYWLALPFIGLGLTIIGFIPIVSIATGIVGLIMFYVENYILAGKELENLKRMPELARKAQEELSALKTKIDILRVIKDFVVNRDMYLPKSTLEIINVMKNGQKIGPSVLKAESDLLYKKVLENRSMNWPGIGNVLEKKNTKDKHNKEALRKKRRKRK